ncbi:hypothetical protein L218DRAFT_1007456 [Marasmius fiardii PR-910]|nr:hypothetical protein L218DRAFT_1007456 [Marasmius fiardii PR-910]
MSAYIPIEVIECIIARCDNFTLSSCSLVSKSWTGISQAQLFKRLSVVTRRKDAEISGKRGVDAIRGRNPKLLQLIEEIHFAFYPLERVEIEFDISHGCVNFIEVLPKISSSFPNLLDLKIKSRVEYIGPLLRFACSFPKLEVLTLECNTVTFHPDPVERCTSTLSRSLKSLHFRIVSMHTRAMEDYKAWLLSQSTWEILHLSLGSCKLFAKTFPYASSLCQNTLKTLEIQASSSVINFKGAGDNYGNAVHDLSPFRVLEAVKIVFSQYSIVDTTLPLTLASLDSPQLRRITLVLNLALSRARRVERIGGCVGKAR